MNKVSTVSIVRINKNYLCSKRNLITRRENCKVNQRRTYFELILLIYYGFAKGCYTISNSLFIYASILSISFKRKLKVFLTENSRNILILFGNVLTMITQKAKKLRKSVLIEFKLLKIDFLTILLGKHL